MSATETYLPDTSWTTCIYCINTFAMSTYICVYWHIQCRTFGDDCRWECVAATPRRRCNCRIWSRWFPTRNTFAINVRARRGTYRLVVQCRNISWNYHHPSVTIASPLYRSSSSPTRTPYPPPLVDRETITYLQDIVRNNPLLIESIVVGRFTESTLLYDGSIRGQLDEFVVQSCFGWGNSYIFVAPRKHWKPGN